LSGKGVTGNRNFYRADADLVAWEDAIKKHWRPAVVSAMVTSGRVFVSTQRGNLFYLETGDANDDGWLMWGAVPEHNGRLD